MDISLDIQDDVALVTMDDGKKNAITIEALQGLEAALDKAEADAAAVVLAGRPGSFCAGFDIKVMTGDDPEARRKLSNRGGRMTVRLFSFPKPLVAACTGHGFTIGAIWMAGCDTRIGERGDFKLGMTETALGMVLPDWALEPLKLRLNTAYFIPAIVQAQLFDPQGALAAGLLDQLVDKGQAIPTALEAAGRFAKLPADAYAGNKLSTRHEVIEKMSAS